MVKQIAPIRLQMVSTRDIGLTAAKVFQYPDLYSGKAVTLAGDVLNYDEMNQVFKEEVGTDMPLTYEFIVSAARWAISDVGKMVQWFEGGGYGGDIAEIKKETPDLQDFRTWLRNSSKFETK